MLLMWRRPTVRKTLQFDFSQNSNVSTMFLVNISTRASKTGVCSCELVSVYTLPGLVTLTASGFWREATVHILAKNVALMTPFRSSSIKLVFQTLTPYEQHTDALWFRLVFNFFLSLATIGVHWLVFYPFVKLNTGYTD